MSTPSSEKPATKQLRWQELPPRTREALEHRLEGLYGQPSDESAFDALAVDKQQALLIIARRFYELDLWATVRLVENVYGEGGVGMNFVPWPVLKSTLEGRKDFTQRFAKHKDTDGGFLETGVGRASLHILYVDGETRKWAAHFDLYNPWASPLNAWRHLLNEKLRGYTPDWRAIGDSLWSSGGEFYLKSV
jgi:hypothetical protein